MGAENLGTHIEGKWCQWRQAEVENIRGEEEGREEGDREGNKVTMVLGDDAKSLHSSPLQMSPGEDENLHSVMGCFK